MKWANSGAVSESVAAQLKKFEQLIDDLSFSYVETFQHDVASASLGAKKSEQHKFFQTMMLDVVTRVLEQLAKDGDEGDISRQYDLGFKDGVEGVEKLAQAIAHCAGEIQRLDTAAKEVTARVGKIAEVCGGRISNLTVRTVSLETKVLQLQEVTGTAP